MPSHPPIATVEDRLTGDHPRRLRSRRGAAADRVVELRRVRADSLVPNPRNWRRHPERQRAALRGLLAEIGYADALLARDGGDGRLHLIDGHLRAETTPAQLVPVLVVDLDEDEADLLLATLDPLAALATPDRNALGELLASLSTDHAGIQALLDELASSAGLPVVWGLVDPEEVPELPAKPRTRPGELWELGEHRLLCGDARDPKDLKRLMDGALADLVFTDPPYGVSYEGKTGRRLRIAGDGAAGIEALLAESFAAIDEVLRPGAALYVCHPAGALSLAFGQAFLAQGWSHRQTLVWDKGTIVLGRSDYHYAHEPILYGRKPAPGRWGRGGRGWYGGNDQASVIRVPRPAASREHPTAKPVELVRRLVANSTRPGEAVLDPFCGSGSTIIACEELRRRGYAVELDPAYCDVIIARWEAFTGLEARRAKR